MEKFRRTFGGKIEGFADKWERAFEKKHLKAYLRGDKKFSYGIDPISRNPIMFDVNEMWIRNN